MSSSLPVIHPHAAGIDIGSEKVFVAVPDQAVRSFETFTASLIAMREYLVAQHITTVAMEATGVYWMPIYDILEAAPIDIFLVNSRKMKYVPGRKSDVQDCQWLQQLHAMGLLQKSFVPDESMRSLRSYMRLRDDHIRSGASHILHMQKAMDEMNIKLHTVISQIQGVSGLRIVRAILAGERNPETLALLCEQQILRTKRERVVQSLHGNYKDEYLFALQQALDLWEFYQQKIAECDQRINRLLATITESLPPSSTPTSKKRKAIRHHAPQVDDLGDKLMRLTGGIDPTTLPAVTDFNLLKAVSEIGPDMSPWPTVKHFTSWLRLAPGKHSSGKRSRPRHHTKHTKAGQIFRQAAQVIGKSKNLALGAFYRRIKAKAGPQVANVATARKLAVLYYNLMKNGNAYVEIGMQRYEQQHQDRTLKYLERKARSFGLSLTPILQTI